MKLWALISLFWVGGMMSSNAQSEDFKVIDQLMAKQQGCWNSGDIECFMEEYWHSDELRFVGKKGVTMGWQNTYDNYKKSYPTNEAMGTLTFEIKSHNALGGDHIMTIGKWSLDFEEGKEPVSGHFSLTWKKIEGEWKIIVDHTS